MNKNSGLVGVVLVGIIITIVLIEFMPMPKRAFAPKQDVVQMAPVQPSAPVVPEPSAPTESQPMVLAGAKYRLVSYNSIASPGSAQYTVSFDTNRVSAKFCNGMGGEYTLKGTMLTAPQLISTMMYCESPKGLMDVESLFGKMLATGAVVSRNDGTLTLTSGKDVMVLALVK